MTASDNLEIRPLSIENAELAAETERLCLNREAWSADGIRETLTRNGYYFAAYVDGEFAGHAGFTAILDEGGITNIAVKPQFRRKGIASALTAELINKSKSLGLIFLTLEVRESNLAAISLYEKHGFTVRGRRKRFYSEPFEDALIMTVDFKEG